MQVLFTAAERVNESDDILLRDLVQFFFGFLKGGVYKKGGG